MSKQAIASPAFLRHYQASKEFREKWMDINLRAAIGIQIREIRLQRGWSQKELAKRAGMTQSRISELEAASSDTTVKTLSKIAAAFECALRVEFVEHSTFIKWIFEIYGTGVKIVKTIHEDLEFLEAKP